MDNIIKQIRKIIGDHWSSQIQINIGIDEIWICIYESEIPIIIDLKKREIYVEYDFSTHHLTSSMLYELYMITELLECKWDVFEELLK